VKYNTIKKIHGFANKQQLMQTPLLHKMISWTQYSIHTEYYTYMAWNEYKIVYRSACVEPWNWQVLYWVFTKYWLLEQCHTRYSFQKWSFFSYLREIRASVFTCFNKGETSWLQFCTKFSWPTYTEVDDQIWNQPY